MNFSDEEIKRRAAMSEPNERDKEIAWELYDTLRNDEMRGEFERIVAGYRAELEAKHAAELAQAKRDGASVSQLLGNRDVQLDILRGDLETVRRERDELRERMYRMEQILDKTSPGWSEHV